MAPLQRGASARQHDKRAGWASGTRLESKPPLPDRSWWAGLIALTTATGALLLSESGPLADLARLVALLAGAGDAAPITLITLGLGLIGLRDRLERGFRDPR